MAWWVGCWYAAATDEIGTRDLTITAICMMAESTKYLKVCLFCLWPISSWTPRRTMAKFCTQTCTNHVQYMSIGVVVTTVLLTDRSSTPIQLTGWQAMSKACAINSVTINSTGHVWDHQLAGCVQGRCVSVVQSFTNGLQQRVLYTVSQKRRHYTLVHIFAKYWAIFTILSPTYSVGTVQ